MIRRARPNKNRGRVVWYCRSSATATAARNLRYFAAEFVGVSCGNAAGAITQTATNPFVLNEVVALHYTTVPRCRAGGTRKMRKDTCAAFVPSSPSVARRGKHEWHHSTVQEFDLRPPSSSPRHFPLLRCSAFLLDLTSPLLVEPRNVPRFNTTLRYGVCPLKTPSLSSWMTTCCPRTSISCGTLTAKVATEVAAAAAARVPGPLGPELGVATGTLRTDGHAGRPGGGGRSDEIVVRDGAGRERRGRRGSEHPGFSVR